MRLLVVEDEKSLRDDITKKLRLDGYEADACGDGNEARELLAVERYDLVLLDINLPGADGMTILREFRTVNYETPVLILSARSEITDKVEGLDAGANDYLSKPFHLAELEARIRSLTRRQFIQRDICLKCGGSYMIPGQGSLQLTARRSHLPEKRPECLNISCCTKAAR